MQTLCQGVDGQDESSVYPDWGTLSRRRHKRVCVRAVMDVQCPQKRHAPSYPMHLSGFASLHLDALR